MILRHYLKSIHKICLSRS